MRRIEFEGQPSNQSNTPGLRETYEAMLGLDEDIVFSLIGKTVTVKRISRSGSPATDRFLVGDKELQFFPAVQEVRRVLTAHTTH